MGFVELGLIRIIVPLVILRFPLAGFLAAELVDKYDWKLLPLDEEADYEFYQYWDKLLDSWYLALAYAVSFRWKDGTARKLATVTFAERMVGVLIFSLSGDRRVLFLFPNVFDGLFVFFEVYRLLSREEILFRTKSTAGWVMAALVIPRWSREYFIHVAEDWPWNLVTLVGGAVDVRLWQAAYLLPQVSALAILILRTRRRQRPLRGEPTRPVPLPEAFLRAPSPRRHSR